MRAALSQQVIRKIVSAEHHDPFQVLGMHPCEGGLIVRAFRPGAEAVWVIGCAEGREPAAMERIHRSGLFEARLAGESEFFDYRLSVSYPGGVEVMLDDPYSFPPVLSDFDLHLFAEGNHNKIYEKLGAHATTLRGCEGFLFSVWAPSAQRVSVVGSFNNWDGRIHPMRVRGASGVWELFLPGIRAGEPYKYEIRTTDGHITVKADPYAQCSEARASTASVTSVPSRYSWADQDWLAQRDARLRLDRPISVYEVHFGSWKRPAGGGDPNYRALADELIAYVKDMGYTHIEFMPLATHPYDPSWGYQVTGYYSPAAQYGSPDDLRYLVDQCHGSGIGVIFDWVPAHFPTDDHALARFDGTCLYEHADPRQSMHPDWGTLVFNYGRNEVRNFLTANALYWFEQFHVDGLRVDAVASMLYLDYSREQGEWIPNRHGGRENLEAIDFIKRLNEIVYGYHPGVLMIAEESTAWPAVSRPTSLGGLGFGLKWNMGWMHDMLTYISKDPVHRKYHHNQLTFALMYSFYENFVLPFSHDEVVHGKGSLLGRMPGDDWRKFANVRALLGYMFMHPGKKLLFMGIDIGQWSEWDYSGSLPWDLLVWDPHRKLNDFVRALNRLYTGSPALYELDFEYAGFEWIDFNDADDSIVTFMRRARNSSDVLICAYNFTPVPRERYRIGVPREAFYREILNSDSALCGGSNMGNLGGVHSGRWPCHGREHSIEITLPPLSCVVFKPE
ncbi:MAG: 1,4-alpha-glucan branching protein GlgB [Deltaproteobacteria bacterium]|nr:1,4-alpha-glucan branching protein GlgB [Deltaproteobacteria bacterium]